MADDSTITTAANPAGRTASREVRLQQLIDATIGVLAAKGYAAVTLRSLAQEYQANWRRALDQAKPEPAARLAALLLADFDPAHSTPQRISAWIAFWGESQGRPLYDAICAEFDRERLAATTRICATLISDGG